jgi:TRAP-type uncharacterized transport system fused permease subunit
LKYKLKIKGGFHMKKNLKVIILAIVPALVLFLLTFASSAQEAAKKPADRPVARPAFRMPAVIKSAEILPDNSLIFRLLSKEAGSVSVSGDWMTGFGASVPMVKNDTNLWTLQAGPLKPELYSYTFLINGVKVLDPNNPLVKRDGTRKG